MSPINKIYNLIGKLNEDQWNLHECGLKNIEEMFKGRASTYSSIDFSRILNENIKKEIKYYSFKFLESYNYSFANLKDALRVITNFVNYLGDMKEKLLSIESLEDTDDYFHKQYIDYLKEHNIAINYRKNVNDEWLCMNRVARFPLRIKTFLIDEYNSLLNRECDIWCVKDFKISPHRINLCCDLRSFRFYDINNSYNKQICKKYMKYLICETEISISYITSKFVSVKYFLKFIDKKKIKDIERGDIEAYKKRLLERDIADRTYNVRLFGVSDFLEYCIKIKEVKYNHVYIEYDILKASLKIRGDIVEQHVIEEILSHSEDIPENYFLMFLILYCCGMRISEVCSLKIGCLKKDENGYYIVFYMQKMKKEVSNPIPENLYYKILEYQEHVKERFGDKQIYLFPKKDGMPILSNTYKDKMQLIIKKFNIRNSDGSMYNFRPHEYRHTFATNLVEKDIPFTVIQKLLHHNSPEMSLVYTQLSDSRKRRKYVEFINIVGKKSSTLFENNDEAEKIYEVQWLKKNLKSQALPNGFCSLPVSLGHCPHANVCLTCEHFRTTPGHIKILKKQLERTKNIIEILKEKNLKKQLDINIKIKENLERLIETIEEGDNNESF